MRRSIDDRPFDPGDYPPDYEEEELTPVGWAVAISDDYGDEAPVLPDVGDVFQEDEAKICLDPWRPLFR